MTNPERFDLAEIKALLRREDNIARVLRDLYGEDPVFDGSSRSYRIADIRGGQGRSCQIGVAGEYAGRFTDQNPDGSQRSGSLLDAVMAVRGLDLPRAITYIVTLLRAEPRLRMVPTGAPGTGWRPEKRPDNRPTASAQSARSPSMSGQGASGFTKSGVRGETPPQSLMPDRSSGP